MPAGMSGRGAAGTVDLTLDVIPPTGAVLPVLINPHAHDQVVIDIERLT